MQQQQQSKTVQEIVAAIEALDLEPIKFKLMDEEEGEGWSREYVDQMEIAYKRFLTLVIKYPEQSLAPTKDIDTFWHGHILDTMKYAEDCHKVFGFFLHHFPYFGLRGEEDASNLAEAGKTLDRLYEREFGERIAAAATVCGAAQPTVCGASVQTAVCGAAKPTVCGASVGTAVCGATIGAAMNTSARPALKAVCGAAKPTVRGTPSGSKRAVCGAAKPTVCGATIESRRTVCGAASPTVCGASIQSAVCGATIGAALNTSVRPTLKRAA